MKVGYVVLYEDGTLVISKKHTILQKPIYKDYGEFDDTNVPWKNEAKEIKAVRILHKLQVTSMKRWFLNCEMLDTLIGFKNLDTSNCINFEQVFAQCENLKDIEELKYLNVSNGVDFSLMFCQCGLTDISALMNWDMSNCKIFFGMFRCCESLTDISSIQNWDVSNGEHFTEMFMYCNLKSVFIDTWTISNKKTYMNFTNMFACNESLTNIYMPNSFEQISVFIFLGCNKKLKIHWKDKIYTYDDLIEYQEF